MDQKNYHIILLPKLETQKMVYKTQRKTIQRPLEIFIWAHLILRARLMTKARKYVNRRGIISGEGYTIKTCRKCGFVCCEIGGSKVFKCPQWNQISDKDFNSVSNIVLKTMNLVFMEKVPSLYSWIPWESCRTLIRNRLV